MARKKELQTDTFTLIFFFIMNLRGNDGYLTLQ